MALEVIAFVIAVAGLVVSFKLTGSAARTVRKWYVISLCLALGGVPGFPELAGCGDQRPQQLGQRHQSFCICRVIPGGQCHVLL